MLYQSQQSSTTPITPQPFDVLCSRGKDSFYHEGNHQFRVLIAKHAETYKMAPMKKQKMQVIALVTDIILARGGRFLTHTNDVWSDAGRALGKKKVGHAFRDALRGRVKCISQMMNRMHNNKMETETPTSTISEDYWSETHSESSSCCETSVSSSDDSPLAADCLCMSPMLDTLEPSNDWMTSKMDPDVADDLLSFFFAESLQ